MYYLYGSKGSMSRRLVATFSSEQQLQAYVRWATLSECEGVTKFEQGSPLASYDGWSHSDKPLTSDDSMTVEHNPSPSML